MTDDVDLLVMGGGPAGSTAAAIAAKAGVRVRILEAARHPREHVGESLLPGIIPVLEEIGALDVVERAGFVEKTGALYRGWGRTPAWDLWFEETDAYDHAWLVDRARFDQILLDAARRAGVEVVEDAVARELEWNGERLEAVRWAVRGDATVRTTRAPQILDATGQAALIARALGLRTMIPGLRHRALWAHYEHAGRLPPPRDRQALLSAQAAHWIWVFPITAERTSVGIVLMEESERDARPLERLFDESIAAASDIVEVLGPSARRVSEIRVERDFSYRLDRVAGPGYLIAGDAAGFIDPILSTGVMLAMHAGWHAGRTVVEAHREPGRQAEVYESYETHYRKLFGDLLRMVRFFYQQNLERDDYFWESKRILATRETELRPQKAFLILTSGLVENLAFDERRAVASARRTERTEGDATTLEGRDPDTLGFVCIHLRHHGARGPVALFFLIEPKDPGEPTLFRTRNWHLNCLAPKYGNDPIMEPALAPHLRALRDRIEALDDRDGEPLAEFWQRGRREIADAVAALPREIELVRVFGE